MKSAPASEGKWNLITNAECSGNVPGPMVKIYETIFLSTVTGIFSPVDDSMVAAIDHAFEESYETPASPSSKYLTSLKPPGLKPIDGTSPGATMILKTRSSD